MANKGNRIWGEEFDVTASVVILGFSVDPVVVVVVVGVVVDVVVGVVVDVVVVKISGWRICWF